MTGVLTRRRGTRDDSAQTEERPQEGKARRLPSASIKEGPERR